MELAAGQTLGDYEILGLLGSGGMGKVYQVRNLISRRVEAMKVLLPDLTTDRDLVERFLNEIRISASLDHPNIAALRTAQRVGNQLIMIMEFVEGSTLDQLMRAGKIPLGQGLDYMAQSLTALSYAHARGVVHRDIKPPNIMLTPAGVIKLMDFGIAKIASDSKLTKTGVMVGSVYYMSPEQIEGRELDGRSDLYSLGVTLYEVVTGKRPFNGDSEYQIMAAHLKTNPQPPLEWDSSLPPRLNEIIMMALEKDPARRFQSADAFRRALGTLSAAQAPKAKPVEMAAPPPAAVKRDNRLLYMVAGSVATVAVIAAALWEAPKFWHAGAATGQSAAEPRPASTAPDPAPVMAPAAHQIVTPVPSATLSADGSLATPRAVNQATPPNLARTQQASKPGAQPPVAELQAPILPPMPPQPIGQQPLANGAPTNAVELSELRERMMLMNARATAWKFRCGGCNRARKNRAWACAEILRQPMKP